jgi:protein arginine kinase
MREQPPRLSATRASARSGTSSASTRERAVPALPAWAREASWESDVVLSTRARLARNVKGVPFPCRAAETDLHDVVAAVEAGVSAPTKGLSTLRIVDVHRLDPPERATLVDSHLISVQHATAGPWRWALVDDRHTVSVMLNEEDHLRIQAILPGLQLTAAWQIADSLDDAFAGFLDYARDPRYGYLTSSLSNCGTGLRVSVMAHLPGLDLIGRIQESLNAAQTLGVSVRGTFGEHSGTAGDVYQLSNAVSIGLTESQLIARLSAVTTYLVTDEKSAREVLWRTSRDLVEAKVADAAARLKSATRLTSSDAMSILSMLRLGHQFGIPTGVSPTVFNELLASMRMGAQFVSGQKAQYTFYEETRRPALIQNKIRENRRK